MSNLLRFYRSLASAHSQINNVLFIEHFLFNNFQGFDMTKTLIAVAAIAAMGVASAFVTINVIEFVFGAMERHASR